MCKNNFRRAGGCAFVVHTACHRAKIGARSNAAARPLDWTIVMRRNPI